MRHLGAVAAVLLLCLPGCSAARKSASAARDQEATTAVHWALSRDAKGRFPDVRVAAFGGVVILEGRVNDGDDAEDALRIARSKSRGLPVESRLDVRPK